MLTPTRIRGKNKTRTRKPQISHDATGRDSLLTVPRRKGRPRKRPNTTPSIPSAVLNPRLSRSENTMGLNPPAMSRLERLPIELLQHVFLYSLNLSLPQASPYLGRVLSSQHVRTELVIQAFMAEASDIENTWDGSIQSALLRQKWLTWSFFRQCRETCMLRIATKKFRDFIAGLSCDVQDKSLAEMKSRFARFFKIHSNHLCWIQGLRCFGRERLSLDKDFIHEGLSWTRNDGATFSVSLVGCNGLSIKAKPCARPGLEGGETEESVHGNYLMPRCGPTTQIPEKLLRGPWTQEKGNFLWDLLSIFAKVDRMNSTAGEIAFKGLEDAIREDNVHAIRALVVAEKPEIIRDFDFDAFLGWDEEDDLFGLDKYEGLKEGCSELPDPRGPWIWTSGKNWYSQYSAGVIPTTEHLRIAVLEKHCDSDVVTQLITKATETAVDCDDPELIQWALKDKAKSQSPSPPLFVTKGEFLLDVLEKCRRRQKLRDDWKQNEHAGKQGLVPFTLARD